MPWGTKRYGAGKSTWNRYSGKRYWNKGGIVKRSTAAAKSYKTGVKNQYFNCSVNGYLTFDFEANSSTSNVQKIIPYSGRFSTSGTDADMKYTQLENTNFHGGAMHDRNYRLMCAQYDEVKLVSMTVKMLPTQTVAAGWSLKLGSIIDRNFTYDEWNGDNTGSMVDTEPINANAILSNPGAVIQSFNANKINTMNRYCYVKDLKEKSDFVDATIRYYATANASPLAAIVQESWLDKKTNFSPCFFYTLQANLAPTAATSLTFSYTVEYNFIFRNPKNGIDRFLKLEQVGYVNPPSRSADSNVRDAAAATTEDGDGIEEEIVIKKSTKKVTLEDATPKPFGS